MAICLNKSQIKCIGSVPMTKETHHEHYRFHPSSQTLPLSALLSPTSPYQKIHHLYFLALGFVISKMYEYVRNIYFANKFEYKFNKKT